MYITEMAELSVNIENESQSERSEDEQTLDLSCGSSSFDESVTDEVYDPNSIKPFRFEPYESGSNESDSVDSDDHENIDNRLQNTDWCTCGNCISMPTAAESVCCHEVEKIHHLFTDLNSEVHCITAHPGFQPACLNTYVLQIAYYQYKQQYREDIEDSSEYV
ncbi:uncharacterized protein LOC134250211 [Saccostrea cucullata]|uniref:uncharacterized protein LOC134250211 n=1 Tax=Saccostrea cuccullata TaxID=36930 RepID=UPI002ED5A991